jgi:hypothetical protein
MYVGSTSATNAVTVAGFTLSGGSGYSEFNGPTSIRVDLNGVMYIMDRSNYRVVKWLPGQPLGFTVAAGASGSTLDKIGLSYAICLDNQTNIYISDYTYHRVTMWLNGNTTTGYLVSSLCMNEKRKLNIRIFCI